MLTKKGKGYLPAEKEPSRFHGTEPFDIRSGKPLKKKEKDSYTDVFAKVMYDMGEKEPSLVAITAAMEDGTGLAPFHRKYRNRCFDVGIAEGHAVTFAAGLAAGGLKPVFAVYSSFYSGPLTRSSMMLHSRIFRSSLRWTGADWLEATGRPTRESSICPTCP